MPVQFYNTLTKRKEIFEPQDPQRVQIYVCGVTVYDRSHIGHGRCFTVWDTLWRYLEWRGYGVQYVQNFTDLDDKILQRAEVLGVSWQEVVRLNIQDYFTDMALLNIRPAQLTPRVTESLPEIQTFIEALIAKDFAYGAQGDVYYAVRNFVGYGKLSGNQLDQLKEGASQRVSAEDLGRKRDPLDFALWKAAKPGEPAWDTPFGPGRPGWHIECSAMIRKHMGTTIDIHAGGEDLIFPHHECEIAQSEALQEAPLAKYWLHNAFVKVNGEKMSKSLGNFITISAASQKYHPLALRLLILQSHYRTTINFTDESLAAAQEAWNRIRDVIYLGELLQFDPQAHLAVELRDLDFTRIEHFTQGMDQDLGTPQGLGVIFDLVKKLLPERNIRMHGGQMTLTEPELARLWRTLMYLLDPLGLIPPLAVAKPSQDQLIPMIEAQISLRRQAKEARDFVTADLIRAELLNQGVVLVDNKDRTTSWHWQD